MNKENRDIDFIQVHTQSFIQMCEQLETLQHTVEELQEENLFLAKELESIKQLSMFEFGNIYCSNESLEADGHAFARSLLGKPISPAETAAEKFESEVVDAMGSYLGDDY